MKIVTVCFDMKEKYSHLLKLLKFSAKKHMRDSELICISDPEKITAGNGNIVDTSLSMKLHAWNYAVQTIDDDLILCDVDMIFLDDLSSVFNQEFDVAYTVRKHKSVPINSGIVFVKNSERVKAFFALWLSVNMKMYHDKAYLESARQGCTGMNQPALDEVRKHPEWHDCKLLELPCSLYNACESEWRKLDKNVKVLHLKETLRTAIAKNKKSIHGRYKERFKGAFAIYDKYHEEMTHCEVL